MSDVKRKQDEREEQRAKRSTENAAWEDDRSRRTDDREEVARNADLDAAADQDAATAVERDRG